MQVHDHSWWMGLGWSIGLVLLGYLVFPNGLVYAQAAGKPGGPCLPNDICTDGAQCYKLSESPTDGKTCLLPAQSPDNTGNGNQNSASILQSCPPQHRYLSCVPDNSNCQLKCIYPKGFGCSASPPPPSLWGVLLILLLFRLRNALRSSLSLPSP